MEVPAQLIAWESYYVIVGSSGAALTGLQFVVMALIKDSSLRSTSREIGAFSTPTIVHFCAALLVSAILSAPWQSLASVRLALGACGLGGVVYGLIVVRRARSQSGYKPVWQDWLWHTALPLIAYALLLISSLLLPGFPERALFLTGGVVLLLLFIGIHNAWDTVTYIASDEFKAKETKTAAKAAELSEASEPAPKQPA